MSNPDIPSLTDPGALEDGVWTRLCKAALQDLASSVTTAERAIGSAFLALTTLVDELYDMELVEGPAAADIRAELDTAARALRNVDRTVRLRSTFDAGV